MTQELSVSDLEEQVARAESSLNGGRKRRSRRRGTKSRRVKKSHKVRKSKRVRKTRRVKRR